MSSHGPLTEETFDVDVRAVEFDMSQKLVIAIKLQITFCAISEF